MYLYVCVAYCPSSTIHWVPHGHPRPRSTVPLSYVSSLATETFVKLVRLVKDVSEECGGVGGCVCVWGGCMCAQTVHYVNMLPIMNSNHVKAVPLMYSCPYNNDRPCVRSNVLFLLSFY
jgi:hypothetical protein